MKLLFQYEFQKEDREAQFKDILSTEELTENDKEYMRQVIEGVTKNLERIDALIENNSKGWKLSRMSKVDVAILRIAIYELSFMEDIPASVTINEAVEIAKKFSSKESGAFINGILGKIAKLSLFPSQSEKSDEPQEREEDQLNHE